MNILKKILLPVAICAVVLLNLVGCGTKGKKSENQTTEQTPNEQPTGKKTSSEHPEHPTDKKTSSEHPEHPKDKKSSSEHPSDDN
jgi:type IV secretory pathway VirB10-like protein